MAEDHTDMAPEVEPTEDEQRTETASATSDDEPRFTQRQVNALIASAKRKIRRERAEQESSATPAKEQGTEIDSRLRELDDRLARIDFREWAAEQKLNADQRRYLERIIDIKDSDSWGSALESESSILQRLATEPPARQAPRQPVTADSPGAARVKDSLAALTGQDVARMSGRELGDLWAKEIRGNAGNGLFVAPNKRGK
jgi:hypothetical protein